MCNRHYLDRLPRVVPERLEGHRKSERVAPRGPLGPARLSQVRVGCQLAQLQLYLGPVGPRREPQGGIETEVAVTRLLRTAGEEDLELDRTRPTRGEQVESQVEISVVMPEPDAPHRPSRRMHGTEERADINITAGLPLLLIHYAVELGRDLAVRPLRG